MAVCWICVRPQKEGVVLVMSVRLVLIVVVCVVVVGRRVHLLRL